jgi:O-antigen biosynthesis protein WbqV
MAQDSRPPGLLARLTRPAVAYVHDVVMAAVAFVLALELRTGASFSQYSWEFLALGTVSFTAVAAVVFWRLNLYRGIWRYASLNDLVAIARAVTLVILLFLPIMFVTTRLDELPRSHVVISWFVLMILLAGPRIAYRLVKDGHVPFRLEPAHDRRVRVLLVGAGDGAEMFIQATQSRHGAEYRPVGIIDDSAGRRGRRIHDVEVLGALDDLPRVLERLDERGARPQRLVITKPEIRGAALSQLMERAEALGLTVARLPRLTEFRAAGGQRLEIQPIALDDLLGRPQTVLDRQAMRALVESRRVLVTGAGGTIGAELTRQIAELAPSRLVMLDNAEFNLYAIDLELSERFAAVDRRMVLADIRDRERLDALFAEERPQLVFHAAALKHVPIVELNPLEGVLTNVIGTRHVADGARAHGGEAVVVISTDKAVNPTSTMGATKRLAESYCQAVDVMEQARGGTRFVTVRFGNVLGSTGSVVPLFQRQLARGGPLTVTHPDMTRYFMTQREAVELVLQAAAFDASEKDRQGGRIFVLDMGQPVRILDLARQLIRLAGLTPHRDITIEFTGLRAGEKLAEQIFHPGETPQPTAMAGILRANPRAADHALLARALDELEVAARAGRGETTLSLLARLVPEFAGQGDPRPLRRAAD